MDIARIAWTRRRQFVGTDQSGHSIVMDSSPEYNGDGSGVRPIELVLHGLAGCTGMDVISVLEKKRQDVRGLEVIVHGLPREDEYPHIYTNIEIEYVVTGYGVDAAAVARAIELSESKYCPVNGMLGEQVSVTTSYKVVEAEPPATIASAGEE